MRPAAPDPASANSRTMMAAVSGKRRGVATVGCSGHVIVTMGDMPAGSTSTTVIMSWGDRVIWPRPG
jgi:hypothetical protein